MNDADDELDEDELDIVVEDEVGQDLVHLLRGVVVVPEEVVADVLTNGGGQTPASRRPVSQHPLVDWMIPYLCGCIIVDVYEDEQRVEADLGTERQKKNWQTEFFTI